MRSDKEMFDLIIGVAEKDERIRAVYMNGSRTNPNVPKDIFQDYDIVYVVNETGSFLKDMNWIHVFGDLLIIQEPDKNNKLLGKEMDFDRSYTYLMLFTDGNRIDLHIETIEAMLEGYGSDKLTIPLLDKDNILPRIGAPTDIDYHVKKPTEAEFIICCNEFWWCLQNVAKGIWRDELPYAKLMFEYTSKAMLDCVVSWWIGMKHDFRVSPGKLGKYFKKFLPEHYWEMYKKTYSDSHYDNMWASIFVACDLFRKLAKEIAENLSFTYPIADDTNMMKYLKRVRELPADAEGIF
ncbi:MAG TPA: aminoglycoside 6-adenylyltransferase [Bacillus sp. (in: firmicutes)]|uniref:aminoglycoside 6-adenylyltransferase n=1 Tax=Bacillus litorisediminis TaxID=2922713 RepID=UPI001FAE22D5|nr:aminoglycoside 6-adenylyltransferase [Bacillus litorisediminis]HWO74432.1 aminoglycoside 6-adenylyltransferase [Bacillus sp. (in: firmicutes)]